jgi:hypothetical protein
LIAVNNHVPTTGRLPQDCGQWIITSARNGDNDFSALIGVLNSEFGSGIGNL